MKSILSINIIPKNRFYYAFLGLILASLLFATTATTLVGVYSYVETYLGESEDVMIVTKEGSGRTIATSFTDLQISRSSSYIDGIIVASPETLTPCVINGQIFVVRGVEPEKFSLIDNLAILDGREISILDLKGAMIGKRVAQKLNLAIGSKFTIFSSLRDVTIELTTLGIFEATENSLNDEVIVPLSVGQWVSGHYPSLCSFIRIKFNPEVISKQELGEIIMQKHSLDLTILDNETNNPIDGATIKIYNTNNQLISSDLTDTIGKISYELIMGNYTINISYNGIEKSKSVFLKEDTLSNIYIYQSKPKYNLRINVYNETSPLGKHTITIWQNSQIVDMGQTNNNGTLNITLNKGEYQVSTYYLNPDSKSQIDFSQYIDLVQNRTCNFYFQNYSVNVYILDPITKEYIDAEVKIKSIEGSFEAIKMSGMDGFVNFINLRPDLYNISIVAGESKQYEIFTLRSDLNKNFLILPFFKLNISIYNFSNSLPINANVSIINLENNKIIHNMTGSDGNVIFNLESRFYNIIYEFSEYSNSEIINLNKFTNITFWIPPYYSSIKVINSTYNPMNNINVSISNSNSGFNVYQNTNSSGQFDLFLFPDEYNLTINYSQGYYSTLIQILDIYQEIELMIPPYNVSVQVFNGSNNELSPVGNISVLIYNSSNSELIINDTANSEGFFNCFLNPNLYNISIQCNNTLLSKEVEIDYNKILYFYTPPYNLTINITSALNKNPLENASIYIYKLPENQEVLNGNSSSSGIFKCLLEESGIYNISIYYNNSHIYEQINIDSDPVVNFTMPPYNISLLVSDINGPLPNANVSVNFTSTKLTDSNGYVWYILNQDKYNITAQYGSIEKTISLDLKQFKPSNFLEIRLIRQHNLNISVLESISGDPIENARIKIYYNDSLIEESFTYNGNAKFNLDQTSDIYYNISVEYNNLNQFRLLNLTSDQWLNFSIIKNNIIDISVLDGFNNPIEYAEVILESIDGIISKNLFTNPSGKGIFYVEAGSYNITVKNNEFSKQYLFDIWENEKILFYLPPYQLNVFVKNSSHHLLENIEVELSFKNGTLIKTNYTNNFGKITFNLNENEYLISIKYQNKVLQKIINTQNLNSTVNLIFTIYSDEKSDYTVANPTEYSSSLLEQTFGLTKSMVYTLTTIITILVSLSIMNVVSSSINESRKNIGMVKALGANKLQIYLMTGLKIIIISLLAGLIGGILGIFLGSYISLVGFELYITQIFSDWTAFIEILILSLLINLAISFTSSTYTLMKLNKITTAEALREILTSK